MPAPRRNRRLTHRGARHPQRRLAQFFARNGYTRAPSEERRRETGRKYKKGWEVRLVLKSQDELDEVRRLLKQAGLKAGKPFRKGKQLVQPIYGKKPVHRFVSWAPGFELRTGS